MAAQLQPGDPVRIGPYRLVARLGSGAMGHVYLGESPAGRPVAVRQFRSEFVRDVDLRHRLARDLETARRVAGRNVAVVVDAEPFADPPWMASAYVAGPSLADAVRRQGPLSTRSVTVLAAGLTSALEAIHAVGLLHRDLKPSNVLLAVDGPRVIDFGIPRAIDVYDYGTRSLGPPGYLAPEQAEGVPLGWPADVFSLGAVLAFAAMGRGPFGSGSPMTVLSRVVGGQADLDGVPSSLRPLIERCLRKDPAARPTPASLLEQLSALGAGAGAMPPDWPAEQASSLETARVKGERTIRDIGRDARPAGPGPEPGTRGGVKGWKPVTGAGKGLPPPPPAVVGRPADDGQERPRFLTGLLPERAPAGHRISLIVQITLAGLAGGASAALKSFSVPPDGRSVTITVSAPGIVPVGDLEQDLFVPFAADSEPIRFGFRTGRAGLHPVTIRAFSGGTCLGDLALQVSVEAGAALEEGPPRAAVLDSLAAEPGEVTLQVSRTEDNRYSFQLISDALYPVEVTRRLAGDPSQVVGALVEELRAMSAGASRFSDPALIRNRLRNLGAQLWADVVPDAIQRQFWAQGDRIKLFTIASDMDTVPWELLYPVNGDNDNGFLVEQFPVVRRVYGQGRARVLPMASVAYVVPPGSPADAVDEVRGVRGLLPAGIVDRGVHESLGELITLLETAPNVLHFACHNAFTQEGGSVLSLAGGPLRPSDLALAVQKRRLEAASPLVFFNACRTAGEIPGLFQLMGWARHFMGAGAGAFIGSLWAVRSSSAKVFAEAFYRGLISDGLPLGAASLRARQAISGDPGDPTWLAYTVYGNPAASARRA